MTTHEIFNELAEKKAPELEKSLRRCRSLSDVYQSFAQAGLTDTEDTLISILRDALNETRELSEKDLETVAGGVFSENIIGEQIYLFVQRAVSAAVRV